MSQALQEFLTSLDYYSHRVPLAELNRRLEDLRIDLDEIRDYLVFNRDHYRRNLIRAGAAYHS